MATSVDRLGIELLGNIIARLPAVDFASANAVNSLFHRGCRRVLSRPKLLTVCSLNPSLKVAVDEVVDKILSKPLRPYFAIASIGFDFDFREAEQLITERLGSNLPIITHSSNGFIGRNALSEEFIETRWDGVDSDVGIMLTVGFLPWMEVKKFSLLTPGIDERLRGAAMIDKFILDIREFSNSISGCNSPAAIIMFGLKGAFDTTIIMMEKLDNEISPETIIVGDLGCDFKYKHADAVALVFVKDKNKPFGIKETQFHCISSSGMLPIGPTYEVTSFEEDTCYYETSFTAKKEGSHENLNGGMILKQAHDEAKKHSSIAWRSRTREAPDEDECTLYTGVSKRRKCSVGQENFGLMTSIAFHEVLSPQNEDICVDGLGLETGDTFRFYLPDSPTALSSAADVANHLRSFKQASTSANGDHTRKVFGCLIFSSCTKDKPYFGQVYNDIASFSDNFPRVTLGVTLCDERIGRGDLSVFAKDSQERKPIFSCEDELGAAYLIMSYTP